MNRILLGGLLSLLMVGLGLFWWQGRAQVEEGAPPPEPLPMVSDSAEPEIPASDAGDMRGPTPPEATELTREQRRFYRYDRNRDQSITRNEMLSTRTDAFRKLDKDGNNLLTFEEWAVATSNRFEKADSNSDKELSPEEFATTRPKRKKKPACNC
ncbi:EF-hand domain-containing protein [Pontixanthobacter sp. CEM42]|uniref:EF-hand domain-containing protein n=1 Tax=Pontixanthobacter sp. CEM42 TaxID=2792077 RepID=UPI001ADF4066|nr:EF-hand domain-containing protein [Pontixanthobacter sp. CEM42]